MTDRHEHRVLPPDVVQTSGEEVVEIIRRGFAGDPFRIERRGNAVHFVVKASKTRWKSATQEAGVRQADRRTLLERLEAAGLLGCLDSGLKDLATNPKHLEGFGGGKTRRR